MSTRDDKSLPYRVYKKKTQPTDIKQNHWTINDEGIVLLDFLHFQTCLGQVSKGLEAIPVKFHSIISKD